MAGVENIWSQGPNLFILNRAAVIKLYCLVLLPTGTGKINKA